jgi:hypothetical protein
MKPLLLIIGSITMVILFIAGTADIIDMHKMEDNTHTFGYWDSYYDMWEGVEPYKTVEIPLEALPNGKKNYAGNPSTTTFTQWIATSVIDTTQFTLAGYHKFMEEHK